MEDRPEMRRTSLTIESGIASLLYYQQEQSQAGYDQQQKPMKTSARVMLAVATGGAALENYISVLDFGLSREGKLAQVPDNIDLGTALSQGSSEDLERLSKLEEEILDLEYKLNNNLFYFTELDKIQASDKQANDHFGTSVAISGDCAIVGAYLSSVTLGKVKSKSNLEIYFRHGFRRSQTDRN